MKNLLSFTIAAIGTIAFLSNFTSADTKYKSFVFMTLEEEPNLPETPYVYSDITFPDHILNGDTIETGYETGIVDTLAFVGIDDDKATLGRVLFYDKKLSALENISCATCHDQSKSFTEDKPLSEGINFPTKRNSMHLNDLAWTSNNTFFWDMSQTDLHEMIVLPLTDENEIGANMSEIAMKLSMTSYYPELFEKAYGPDQIGEEAIVDALVQFIESMTTFNSRFDKQADSGFNDLTDKELLGLELFQFNCSICHTEGQNAEFFFEFEDPIDFPIFEMMPFFFNNGLPIDEDDSGTGEWHDLENLYKLPTLRNIELTAPYMHDGRFATLEDVVNFYSEETEENEWSIGFIPPDGFQFSELEKEALVDFMKMLTDDTFLTDVKFSDPFKDPSSVSEPEGIELTIKPNPMFESAILEFDNNLLGKKVINIYDATGKMLLQDNTEQNEYILDKTTFTGGVYFIEVLHGEKRSSHKLIVQ